MSRMPNPAVEREQPAAQVCNKTMNETSSIHTVKSAYLRKIAWALVRLAIVLIFIRVLVFQVHQYRQIDVRAEMLFNLSIYTWGWLFITAAAISIVASVVMYVISWKLQREHA